MLRKRMMGSSLIIYLNDVHRLTVIYLTVIYIVLRPCKLLRGHRHHLRLGDAMLLASSGEQVGEWGAVGILVALWSEHLTNNNKNNKDDGDNNNNNKKLIKNVHLNLLKADTTLTTNSYLWVSPSWCCWISSDDSCRANTAMQDSSFSCWTALSV